MEPIYSPWKESLNAYKQMEMVRCPYCEKWTGRMMIRYVTNRDGETEKQYRVECPICQHAGKVYLHKSVAEKSWEVRENDPIPEPLPPRRRKYSDESIFK